MYVFQSKFFLLFGFVLNWVVPVISVYPHTFSSVYGVSLYVQFLHALCLWVMCFLTHDLHIFSKTLFYSFYLSNVTYIMFVGYTHMFFLSNCTCYLYVFIDNVVIYTWSCYSFVFICALFSLVMFSYIALLLVINVITCIVLVCHIFS